MDNLTELAEELRIVIGQLRRTLRAQSSSDSLSWSQISVIGHLARAGTLTVTQLADAEGVKSQSMGATLNRLHHLKLVEFEKDSEDGRKKYVALTRKGHQILDRNRAQRDDWLVSTMQSSLTSEEQHTLRASIALLQRLANRQH